MRLLTNFPTTHPLLVFIDKIVIYINYAYHTVNVFLDFPKDFDTITIFYCTDYPIMGFDERPWSGSGITAPTDKYMLSRITDHWSRVSSTINDIFRPSSMISSGSLVIFFNI